MRTSFFSTALGSLILLAGSGLSQQLAWNPTAGPRGGVVLTMITDHLKGRVWSGNGFYSSDRGATWVAKPSGVSPGSPQSHFTMANNDYGNLYTGNFGGSFRSSDGGDNWAPMFLPGSPSVIALATHIDEVWAGSYQGKIFRSIDKGSTWTKMHDSSDFLTDVMAVISFGPTVYAGTYGNGVMKSTDGGKTWKSASNGLLSSGVESLMSTDSSTFNLLAGTNGEIYFTSSGGANWQQVSSIASDIYDLKPNQRTGIIYAATNKGVYRSAGPLGTWLASNAGLTTLAIRSVTVDTATNTIYAGTATDGVFRSTNNGDTWEQVGTPVAVFSLTAYQGKNILAGTNDSLFATSDAGASWRQSNTGIPDQFGNIVYTDTLSGKIFAGTHKGVYVSTDNAATWTLSDSGITNRVYHGMLTTKANEIFLATSGGLFVSADEGKFWSLRGTGLLDSVIWDSVISAIAYDTAGYMYAAKTSGVYRSTNDGGNWQLANAALPGNVYSLCVVPNGDVLAGLSGDIYRSGDRGSTWTPTTSTINSPVNQIVLAGNNKLLAATSGDGVFLSADNGASWSAQNSGLASLSVYSLAITDDGYVWAGTLDGGVFRSPLVPSSVKEDAKNEVELTVYPNPSLGTFFVETKENAAIVVEDVTGKPVYVGSIRGGAKNEIRLSNAANGFYFVRVMTKDNSTVRSIAIVR